GSKLLRPHRQCRQLTAPPDPPSRVPERRSTAPTGRDPGVGSPAGDRAPPCSRRGPRSRRVYVRIREDARYAPGADRHGSAAAPAVAPRRLPALLAPPGTPGFEGDPDNPAHGPCWVALERWSARQSSAPAVRHDP